MKRFNVLSDATSIVDVVLNLPVDECWYLCLEQLFMLCMLLSHSKLLWTFPG